MNKRDFSAKLVRNKTNGQLTICLPKNQLKFLKDKTPKRMKFEIKEMEW